MFLIFKKLKLLVFLPAFAAALSSCQKEGTLRMPVPVPQATGVVHVDKPIIIENETFDMGGREYRGHDKDSQFEGGKPLFILKGNARLRNGIITRSAEGVWFEGHSNVLEDVYFPDVFEDATSNRGGSKTARGKRRNVVRRCIYANAQDKAIQQNFGDLEVRDCTFVRVSKPLRQNGGSSERLQSLFFGNTCYSCDLMTRGDGINPKSVIRAGGNRGIDTPVPWHQQSVKTKFVDLNTSPSR